MLITLGTRVLTIYGRVGTVTKKHYSNFLPSEDLFKVTYDKADSSFLWVTEREIFSVIK